MSASPVRSRPDRCPGVLRPWVADDGALVRIRLIGGRIPSRALSALSAVSRTYGDGALHLTSRANLQLRGLPLEADALPGQVLAAIERTGLVPSRHHDLVRNVMVSPLTGISGGRADLRPVAAELDRRLRADPDLVALPGRFLFVLDDGRGDLLQRETDLGLVAIGVHRCQLRVGDAWGPVVPLGEAAATLVRLASGFLARRGEGDLAAWHVRELDAPLLPTSSPEVHLPSPSGPLPPGRVRGAEHVAVPGGVLDAGAVADLAVRWPELVITPWHGVVVQVP